MNRVALALLTVVLASSPVAAQNDDREGCKDHPLFTRFPNTHLASCETLQFDLRAFPVGPVKEDETAKTVSVEGPTQFLAYELNEGAATPSGLQIMRNYENAAKKAGGTIEGRYPGWCKGSYDESHMPDMGNGCLSYALTMRFARAGGKETWVFLQATEDEGSYYLTISDREAMKQDIAVTELMDRLNKDGFITLYVTFDTGKATITPDSAQTLDDAAAVLKAASDVRIEVAGHTDNVGTPEANMALSQARAQAVQAALVQRGVAATRLTAKGYGQTVPVADNRTDDGRAKNRRVELTKK